MACTTILVGKKASFDGSTIIARNDDGGFDTKKVVVVKKDEEQKKYKCVISHLEIELPENPMAYTAAPSVDLKAGIWAACGINEANVAMTATETITSNPRVLGADPYVVYKKVTPENPTEVVGGIGEEDIVVLVLPYIHSAKEGVMRLGELLEKYGTYEPNGIAFSDENEIWWLETIGGHHWIARRVPDEKVVIMPNQFGLDDFDLDDALTNGKENLCSKDLKEFIENNHLDLGYGKFIPRVAFGSRSDADHIYNTPRAWYMARYLNPRKYKWDGENADFTPESDDIPWSLVPENKVTIEDVKYLLASHYQGTVYDPYSKYLEKGKYRTIGVPNTDICGILQIRGYMSDKLKGVEWISLGGGAFTCCFPQYVHVSKLPDALSTTPLTVSTNHMYWQSRLIAALVDAHYFENVVFSERYQNTVFNQSRAYLTEYDKKYLENKNMETLEEANEKIIQMVMKESNNTLVKVLNNSSEHMKTRFHRSDN